MSLKRVAAHVALVGKGAAAIAGAGGVLGVIGLVELVRHGVKHSSGWMWLAFGLLVIVISQIRAVHTAIAMAENQAISQTVVGMAEGADVSRSLEIDRVHM